jgi:hypothetical protein
VPGTNDWEKLIAFAKQNRIEWLSLYGSHFALRTSNASFQADFLPALENKIVSIPETIGALATLEILSLNSFVAACDAMCAEPCRQQDHDSTEIVDDIGKPASA